MPASDPPHPYKPEVRQISQGAGIVMAIGALCGGTLLAGGTHFLATAKKLSEEGVDPVARMRAVPLALKALLVSTVVTSALGASALVAVRLTGMDTQSVATVSTWQTAMTMAQQQREAVRSEFQKRLHHEERSGGQ